MTDDFVVNAVEMFVMEHRMTKTGGCACGQMALGDAYPLHLAKVLDSADLLATPSHDAETRANELQSTAGWLDSFASSSRESPYVKAGRGIIRLIRERAAKIRQEEGVTDG